ncbi:hypothetical protein pSalSNUABM01_153 [Salmonella phage pSal-SNUABM-01]|nr:hypothetical protein pSalSNUABM01_153 [Salmonella phage pSal-SNUABM-01]
MDFDGQVKFADMMFQSTGLAHCVVQRKGELRVVEQRRHKNKPVKGIVYSTRSNQEKLKFLCGMEK